MWHLLEFSLCFRGEMVSLQLKDGPPIGNMASLLLCEDQVPLHEGATNDSETSSITKASAGSGDGDSHAYVAEPSDKSLLRLMKRKMERQYLAGEARRPYRQTQTISDSTLLDGSVRLSSADEVETPAGTPISSAASKPLVCNSCSPVLDKYALTFKSMLKQGGELKRRKCLNPNPHKPDFQHYRDLVRMSGCEEHFLTPSETICFAAPV